MTESAAGDALVATAAVKVYSSQQFSGAPCRDDVSMKRFQRADHLGEAITAAAAIALCFVAASFTARSAQLSEIRRAGGMVPRSQSREPLTVKAAGR